MAALVAALDFDGAWQRDRATDRDGRDRSMFSSPVVTLSTGALCAGGRFVYSLSSTCFASVPFIRFISACAAPPSISASTLTALKPAFAFSALVTTSCSERLVLAIAAACFFAAARSSPPVIASDLATLPVL